MYKRMLVPLDGSSLAEAVFPHVVHLARGCNIPEVWLLQAVEPLTVAAGVEMGTGTAVAKLYEQSRAEATRYLERVAQKLSQEGLTVKYAVLEGEAGEGVLRFVEQNSIDLIVMATHGRRGFSRWIFGSIAEKVLRAAKVPVFLVRTPPGTTKAA